MAAYELATYEPAQRGDYLRLLEDAWGDLALTPDEFDWWFRENPAGSLMSVARDHVEGRLAARPAAEAAGVTAQGKLYVIGGKNYFTEPELAKVEMYTP